jgi:hypothetical protein
MNRYNPFQLYPNWKNDDPSHTSPPVMSIPPDITNILQQLIEPAGAIGLAAGLVRGAAMLEKDANDDAIKHVSDLLLDKDVSNLGKLTVTLVPTIFDKIFGPNPLTIKFAVRSIMATTVFWFILLAAKHAHWAIVWNDLTVVRPAFYEGLVPAWYVLDWISLAKARLLVKFASRHVSIAKLFFFFLLDVILSYILSFIFAFWTGHLAWNEATLVNVASYYFRLGPIAAYLSADASQIGLIYVVGPSTLLTSAWTLLLLLSCIFASLLVRSDGLRRFSKWWFRDAAKHPLTAIAKVAGALIILGAVIIKATASI